MVSLYLSHHFLSSVENLMAFLTIISVAHSFRAITFRLELSCFARIMFVSYPFEYLSNLLLQILTFSCIVLIERAKELAVTIGVDAVTLADLDNFHPETKMILANTTSVGMQPKVDETPIPKVCSYQ